MQQVQVDVIGPKSLQALGQVGVDRFGRDPGRAKLPGLVHVWVASLGDQEDLFTPPRLFEPSAKAFSLSPNP